MQIIPPKASKECATILQLKVHNVYVVHKVIHHVLHKVFHNVLHHEVRKVMIPVFDYKVQMGLAWRAQNVPQNGLQIRLLGFWQKSYSFRHAFFLHYESAMVYITKVP